jgi:NAD(P)-dependent dehydrogenase (short-subunit alcohol dehydrogenase family)
MGGSTVLVTGGTGGIGRATALGLARMGANVAITGRDAARAEHTAREIRSANGVQFDVFLVGVARACGALGGEAEDEHVLLAGDEARPPTSTRMVRTSPR